MNMQEKVVEVLGYLLRQFQEEGEPRLENTTRWLQDSGYTSSEISTALSLFFKKFKPWERAEDRTEQPGRTPFRVMSAYERKIIDRDAYSYLLQLYRLNVITVHEMEQVLERAVIFGSARVALEELRLLAASVIFFDADKKYQSLYWTDRDTIN